MDIQLALQKIWHWLFSIGSIVIIILVSLVLIKVVRMLSGRIPDAFGKKRADEEYRKRASTLRSVIHHAITAVILAVAFMMILKELGIDIGPILAAAGIVGLAVGFGAQSMVKDVINGFFILLEDQIREGDVVQIAGQSGIVERVNLKFTVLRDLSGNVHYIPNGTIDVVTNMTKDFSYYLFDIGVAYREDVDEVVSVIRQADEEFRRDPEFSGDILEPIEILGLDRFADSSVVIRARYKTKPIKQWKTGRAFNRLLKKKFDEEGIEIPFPHVTLYMGQGKKGDAPPVHLRMEDRDRGKDG
jgi:small-conductance mechanosensitive channel